jgi:hypothetical protein
MERTDEGKALRKDYESGKIHHGFNEFREAHIRPDNISNTLSTITKDNLLCIEEGIDLSINDPRKIDVANCITAKYDGGISIRIDLNCMKCEGRYKVYREDGKLYDNWDSV